MKLKDFFAGVVMVVGLFLSSPGLTQQPRDSSNQGGVNESTTYYIGFQKDSAPISYSEKGWSWKGYCYAFVKVLEKQIHKKIEIVPVENKLRFTGKGDNGRELDAYCSFNSITEGRIRKELKENGRDGSFTERFALTGAKVLLPDTKIPDYNDPSKLQELKFGVLRGTTTRKIVENIYPNVVTNNNLVVLEEAKDAIQKIQTGEIDLYVANELVLKSILKQLQYSNNKEKYSILPEKLLLSNEQSAMVVYHIERDKNIRLLEAINSLLREAEFQSFGNTKIKILKEPEFKEVLDDLESLVKEPVKPSENNSYLSFTLYLIFFLISFLIIFIIIWIYRARKNKSVAQRHTQINNDSNNLNIQEARVGLSKSESSSRTTHQINFFNHFSPKNDNTQGDNMPDASKYDMKNSNIGNIIDTAQSGSQQQSTQHIYAPEQKQNLAEAAAQIQELLKQLEETNPTITETEKLIVVSKAAEEIKKDPTLKARVIAALKLGGTEAFKEAIDHPLVNILVAIIQGWQEAE
ncbi:hypothetical protein SAMD00079811_56970 [Scytonema sp. HK-05]|uniref:substrate-binding periplasmic protein n=1 Tax=Scytonema sp. HK-05 TaxID=1137095 RepID=UPI0009F99AA0|nr:transporter substrate-binding domain-containing protein [Scytonema sp. HK-05]BAY48078.1 hypothetical protein SAMD00079811_56970 [Scytonema sp. HK-05]